MNGSEKMLSKTLRENMRAGKPLSGCTISGHATEQIEVLGLLGYDFAFLDSEHWPLTDREILDLITAGDAVDLPCLVRVRENSPSAIQHAMDSGAAGVIVPDVSDLRQALDVVRAVKYSPLGCRGLSTTRASRYGIGVSLAEYVQYANEKSVIVCQIESNEALQNSDEIMSVDEIDVVFIGTTDLSHSMGYTGQLSDPKVTEAVDHIIQCAKTKKKSYGAMVRAKENPRQYSDQGYSMIVASGAGFFSDNAKKYIEQFRCNHSSP
jgi:4-hydroxy-2-oxoheptanedioate aldolase